MQDALQTLTARIEQLEAANRRLARRIRLVAGVGLVAVAAAFTFTGREVTAQEGEKVQDMVRAHTFVAVDVEGKPRAIISGEKGKVGIVLCDHNGKVRVGLVEKHETSAIVCNDQDGKTKVVLGCEDGTGAIEIDDKEGKAVFKRPE